MAFADRLGYLAQSAIKWLARAGLDCPSCGHRPIEVLDRKFLVTQLRRCGGCGLAYRTPTGNASSMRSFYQKRYDQGFTTDLPSGPELEHLLASRFRGTEKDYSGYLDVLSAAGARPGMRLLDFGCSWGYGSWQLKNAGYDVSAFEISLPRMQFARERLHIDAYDELGATKGDFDIIFSAHVLEHLPGVGPTISRLLSMLRKGGKFLAFTPNGSMAYREDRPQLWHACWGLVHPNMLDERYYERTFSSVPHLLTSSPYSEEVIRGWASSQKNPAEPNLRGSELLCIAMKTD